MPLGPIQPRDKLALEGEDVRSESAYSAMHLWPLRQLLPEVLTVSAKERLTRLIQHDNLSSIEAISADLGVSQDEVRVMLQALLQEGVLKGRITPDGLRFFRNGVRVSEQPAVPSKEQEPEFLRFNTRPGRYAAEIGFVVVVISYLILIIVRGNTDVENIAVGMILVGIIMMLTGCYCVGRRKTPM
jgi:hypothetical protein